jgi:hypothetical protein
MSAAARELLFCVLSAGSLEFETVLSDSEAATFIFTSEIK